MVALFREVFTNRCFSNSDQKLFLLLLATFRNEKKVGQRLRTRLLPHQKGFFFFRDRIR